MDLLGILVQRLEPALSAAGYVLVERADDDDPAWVDYRRQAVGSSTMLSITYDGSAGTVHAAIWRPADLVGAASAQVAERAIDWQQTWRIDRATDQARLADEIVRSVADRIVPPPDTRVDAEQGPS